LLDVPSSLDLQLAGSGLRTTEHATNNDLPIIPERTRELPPSFDNQCGTMLNIRSALNGTGHSDRRTVTNSDRALLSTSDARCDPGMNVQRTHQRTCKNEVT